MPGLAAIEFFVPGLPAPGGSKRAFVVAGKARLVDDCKRNGSWRATVAGIAMEAMRGPLLDGPLVVSMAFVVLRPRGHFGTGRNGGKVRPTAPPHPTVKPDVLKLARSTEDALTGVLWRDDCLTVDLRLSKRYGDVPGVRVMVQQLGPALEPDAPIPADVDVPADGPPQVGRSAEPSDFTDHLPLFPDAIGDDRS